MNRRFMSRTAILAGMIVIVFALAACSSSGTADGVAPEGIIAEDGYTITDDGRFVYTVVIENAWDKTVKKGEIGLSALDSEGNKMDVGDTVTEVSYTFESLYPGEKAAFTMTSEYYNEDGSSVWTETPAGFTFCFPESIDWGDADVPQITIGNAKRIITNGDYYVYDLTLKNNGTEDYDWQAKIDSSHYTVTPCIEISEVLRDSEGKIIGATQLYFDEFEQNSSYPVIPAGGEVSGEATISANIDEILSKAESRELIITR